GFTNMVTPTSGVLVAALAMARIPYAKWVKWIWKGVAVLLVLGLLLLLATIWLPIAEF
ncbi:MAG: YfcC family protein, partial [Bacteroidales bacterium]|nr:YfcC family protein [Bacteroidales bacterium]